MANMIEEFSGLNRGFAGGLVFKGRPSIDEAMVIGNAAAEPAVRTIWSIGTELLDQIAVATIGYGVVMVLAAWLAGPTRVATATRRAVAPYWRSPVIAYSGLAVVFLILLWWAPTPAWRM